MVRALEIRVSAPCERASSLCRLQGTASIGRQAQQLQLQESPVASVTRIRSLGDFPSLLLDRRGIDAEVVWGQGRPGGDRRAINILDRLLPLDARGRAAFSESARPLPSLPPSIGPSNRLPTGDKRPLDDKCLKLQNRLAFHAHAQLFQTDVGKDNHERSR